MIRDYPLLLIANPDIEIDEEVNVDEEVDHGDMFKVIIHNDDNTDMMFVVSILIEIFKLPLIFAEGVMWEAHNNGNAVVCVLPKPEAERKVRQARFRARLAGYPLELTIEPAD